jgi:excisionase family DNA binding protein
MMSSGPVFGQFMHGVAEVPPEHARVEAHLAAPDNVSRQLETRIREIVREELAALSRNAGDAQRATPSRARADAPNPFADDVLSANALATFLGVDRNTVYDYAGRGMIPCRRLGKRMLFSRAAIVSWLGHCKAVDLKG